MSYPKIVLTGISLVSIIFAESLQAAEITSTKDPALQKLVTQLDAKCNQSTSGSGPRGPQGPQGPQGPRGPQGLPGKPPTFLDALFNFENNNGTENVVSFGDEIPFNNNEPNTPKPVFQGDSISQKVAQFFVFTETGDYYVSFLGTTSADLSNENGPIVQFQLNNVLLMPASGPIGVANTSIVLDRIIQVTEINSVLNVVTEVGTIVFAAGEPTSLTIIKLSEP